MNILIVGTGYVGLVSGVCYAKLGHNVTCIDIDADKVGLLSQGKAPFYEPNLEEYLGECLGDSKIKFSTSLKEHLNENDIVFICVGTPPKENGQADLSYVYAVAEEIGENLNKYTVVTTKSTVPVGTSVKIKKIIRSKYAGAFDVASCPEFLREGSAIEDFSNSDRTVIGTDSDRAKELLLKIHEQISCPKVTTNIETAEMIKYASNAFLATKISFINEIANVCQEVGADVLKVAEGMKHDKRIGAHFLEPGIGYGGSCFPKDVRALHYIAGENGYQFQLLKSVIEVNNNQKWIYLNKIRQSLGDLQGKQIGVWGLSFKPNTDDIRESIAIDLIEKLLDEGSVIKAYDPKGIENTKQKLGDSISYAKNAEEVTRDIDALLIITEWDEFKSFNKEVLFQNLDNKYIFDGRNIFDPVDFKESKVKYIAVGR